MRKLPRSFYDRDTVEVARDLLGMHLVHVVAGVERVGRIVEVEAYLGPHDLAAHSARGLTPRTRVMFGPPGHAYVYFVYGMHWCANVVTQEEGKASAVLLRALEPVKNVEGRTNGPALLCRAMGIDGRHNGHDLLSDDLYISRSGPGPLPRSGGRGDKSLGRPGRGNAATARGPTQSSAARASASITPATTGRAACCASTSAATPTSRSGDNLDRLQGDRFLARTASPVSGPMSKEPVPLKPIQTIFAGLALASCAHMHTPATTAVTPALRTEFAPSGTLIAGVNFGNPVIAQKDPAGGDPRGVGPELARELARRLGVPIKYVIYDTAGKMADAGKQGAWDVAMLAVDPARAEDIAFSAPYVLIEGTYMVRANSPLKRVEGFDKKGLRISVALKSAYDLYLTREIKQAELVRVPTSQVAIDDFVAGKVDVVAGVRQPLNTTAAKVAGLRVIEGSYMSIGQASGVPKARTNAANYLRAFIEDAKASGFVERKLKESGINDAKVAPAA